MAHNGSLVPIPGRDMMVQAWYQGGVSVLIYRCDASEGDRLLRSRPDGPDELVLAGPGRPTGTTDYRLGDRARAGHLRADAERLTQNEIDAAKVGRPAQRAGPAEVRVAGGCGAGVSRSVDTFRALPAGQIAKLRKAIASAEKSKLSKKSVEKLTSLAPSVEQSAGSAKTPADAARLNALAAIMKTRRPKPAKCSPRFAPLETNRAGLFFEGRRRSEGVWKRGADACSGNRKRSICIFIAGLERVFLRGVAGESSQGNLTPRRRILGGQLCVDTPQGFCYSTISDN